MFSYNNKISLRQLQTLLILEVFGTGVAFIPQHVANYAGQDGWICVVVAMLAIMVCAFLITSLSGMFPNKTFLDYTSELVSKPIAVLISLAFVIKIIIMTAFELRFFGEIVRQMLLEKTPFAAVCIIMLMLGAYAAAKGFETRARIAEILIFIVTIPIFFIILVAATDVDFSNLLPVMEAKPKDILGGAYVAMFAFSGFDFCLLVCPYLIRPKHIKKSVLQSVIFVGVFMTIITVVTIARYGPFDLKHQMWPVLEMMDTANIPGSFLERQGALVMSFWIVSVFAIVNAGLFFSSLLLKDVMKKGKHSTYILVLIPITFILSYVPGNVVELFSLYDYMNRTFGIAFLFFIPLILLIIAKLKKAGESV